MHPIINFTFLSHIDVKLAFFLTSLIINVFLLDFIKIITFFISFAANSFIVFYLLSFVYLILLFFFFLFPQLIINAISSILYHAILFLIINSI